jgi:hypothetical protein
MFHRWNPANHIINKALKKKGKNKEPNGRTYLKEDKWITKEGEPQGEHQVPKPFPIAKNISYKEREDLLKGGLIKTNPRLLQQEVLK